MFLDIILIKLYAVDVTEIISCKLINVVYIAIKLHQLLEHFLYWYESTILIIIIFRIYLFMKIASDFKILMKISSVGSGKRARGATVLLAGVKSWGLKAHQTLFTVPPPPELGSAID